MTTHEPCPCGLDRPYRACCGPLHQGTVKAETAERLMRSRYAAFSKGLVDYLMETLHPSKRSETERLSLSGIIHDTEWLKLEIRDVVAGRADDSEGIVEFMAYFKTDRIGVMRERSRFLKDGDTWYYLDGEHKKPDPPGRNDPCWCGSGRKAKKCHGIII